MKLIYTLDDGAMGIGIVIWDHLKSIMAASVNCEVLRGTAWSPAESDPGGAAACMCFSSLMMLAARTLNLIVKIDELHLLCQNQRMLCFTMAISQGLLLFRQYKICCQKRLPKKSTQLEFTKKKRKKKKLPP